jgi:hypothetical protein
MFKLKKNFFFKIFINYDKSIDKLVKEVIESADKDSDKLTTPFSLITFHL